MNPEIEISARETASLLAQNPRARLIDVRTNQEYATAKIEGALLVNDAASLKTVLSWPRDTPIVVHCHHGFRSLDAAESLRAQGFTDVRSMAGGIEAWSRHVNPAIPRY